MTDTPKNGLTYAEAGVDIDAGNALIDRIKPAAAATRRSGVMEGLGGFGALFDLKDAGFKDPILVSATDGVGTKLRIAIDTGNVDGVGIDLVAMCVNDLVCQGAEPLFFLDYFATGKLELVQATRIINGIAKGCELSGCALIGGETAEMPGMYPAGDFDLAGFSVGAMERGGELPAGVAKGDILLGLASNGVHSNGYSLVRKIVEQSGLGWNDASPFSDGTLGEALLAPTTLYVKGCVAAIKEPNTIHALAHITGGGLTENLPRVLPTGLGAEIDLDTWDLLPVFKWLVASVKRVAILISGGGSNMVALVNSMVGDHPARAVLVVSNDPEAGGLAKAQALGIPTAIVDHREFHKDRNAFEDALHATLEDAKPDFVCLAGFMRILTAGFTSRYEGRMLNIHPSLLPKFKGLHTHARALEAGDSEHGCTVHEVTAVLDDGPILGQARIDVQSGDTPDSLAARLLPLEHALYPAVLRRYAAGDRRLITLPED